MFLSALISKKEEGEEMRKNITLKKMQRADPQAYAELCERSGYKAEALKYYAKSRNENELYHGAELAFDLKQYKVVRQLLGKAEEAARRSLAISESSVQQASMHPEGSGLMGAAMGYWGTQDRNRELRAKISRMEAKLAGVE